MGSGARNNRRAPRHDFDGDINSLQPLVVRQSGSFAGGAAGNQKINSGLDLPRHQVAQGGFVDGAVLTKGCYESCTASSKLHETKISRMGGLGKLVPGSPPPALPPEACPASSRVLAESQILVIPPVPSLLRRRREIGGKRDSPCKFCPAG